MLFDTTFVNSQTSLKRKQLNEINVFFTSKNGSQTVVHAPPVARQPFPDGAPVVYGLGAKFCVQSTCIA